MASDLHFGDTAVGKDLFVATVVGLTAPVIFSTNTGTGGPLIWNQSPNQNICRIVGVSYAVTTASTVTGALGFTGGTAQTAAPASTSTTGLTKGNLNCSSTSQPTSMSVFSAGTPTTAGTWFLPFANILTGALTVQTQVPSFIWLDRAITVYPGFWCSIAGSATLSTLVATVSVIYEEVQLPI